MDRGVFSESEKRFLVTQIIKASSISLERILLLFNESNEDPQWDHIYIPPGRTLQECKVAFEALRLPLYSPFGLKKSPSLTINSQQKRKVDSGNMESASSLTLESKRRLSGIRCQEMSCQQPILPKPSPTESKPSTPQPVAKRRGRPPKAEVERRNQEAIARGELKAQSKTATPLRQPELGENTGIISDYSSNSALPTDIRSQEPCENRLIAQDSVNNNSDSPDLGSIGYSDQRQFLSVQHSDSSADRQLLSHSTIPTVIFPAGPGSPISKTNNNLSQPISTAGSFHTSELSLNTSPASSHHEQ